MWATSKGADDTTQKQMMTSLGSGKSKIFRVQREVHFSDDITYESVHELVHLLKEIEQETSRNLITVKKAVVLTETEKETIDLVITPKPIKLYLTTHGGSVYAALRAVDIIQNLQVPVHTYVSGYVASAGTLLSMAGAKRFITPHSFMLIHELRSSFWGKYSDAREQVENMDKLMDLIIKFVSDKSKIPVDTLKETLSRDRNWGADECIEKGVVDEIIK